MMMLRKGIITQWFTSVVIIIMLIAVSCRKFKDETNLNGKWNIEQAVVDGVDKTAMLDTMYISYYNFFTEQILGPNDQRPMVSVVIDTSRAKWLDASCKYVIGEKEYYYLQNGNKQLQFPPVSAVWTNQGGTAIGIINKCGTDLFMPMFVSGNAENWDITKWKKKKLHLALNYNNKKHEIILKKIE